MNPFKNMILPLIVNPFKNMILPLTTSILNLDKKNKNIIVLFQ